MGQRSDEIKKHIDEQRSELTDNLERLEERVKSTADWRAQFDKRPMVLLGIALGGGLLLGSLVPSPRRRRSTSASTDHSSSDKDQSPAMTSSSEPASAESRPRKPSATSRELRRTWSMVDDVRAALIGVGATKLREYLNGVIPGFGEHYQKKEEERRAMSDYYGEESTGNRASHAGERRSSQTAAAYTPEI